MKTAYAVSALALAVMATSAFAKTPLSDFVPRIQAERELAGQTKIYRFLRRSDYYQIIIGDHDLSGGKRVGGTEYNIRCRENELLGEQIFRWKSTPGMPEYEIYLNYAHNKQDKDSLDEMKLGQAEMPPLSHYTYMFEPHKLEAARPILIEVRKRFLPQIKKREKRLPQKSCIDDLLKRLK